MVSPALNTTSVLAVIVVSVVDRVPALNSTRPSSVGAGQSPLERNGDRNLRTGFHLAVGFVGDGQIAKRGTGIGLGNTESKRTAAIGGAANTNVGTANIPHALQWGGILPAPDR